ncbi:MAG: class I SAM-dependent methyltransferase [Cyanobacteria bacterium HKST-UBA04]|nr:class I SAM-dependent methyltransferase [Cyanobacteria bacterium HKST-UBA04]MCA9842150.1 class I SAM-dependent methyltransferase [Cyanobacteria bacterium HKST-UBA03]
MMALLDQWFTAAKNATATWSFNRRNRQAWQRGPYNEPRQDKAGFFADHPDLGAQEALLRGAYPRLEMCQTHSTLSRYRENLNLLAALDALGIDKLPHAPSQPCRVLEVGIKNWSTLDALAAWLAEKTNDSFAITGVELDPWRRYQDGHSRWDYATTFAHRVPEAHAPIAGDILDHTGMYDTVVCVLPFVFAEPHLSWGLPLKHFNPPRFFAALHRLVAPGGTLILFNQGDAEFEAQRQLLAPYGYTQRFSGSVPQPFYPYAHPRYGWWLSKPNQSCPKTAGLA